MGGDFNLAWEILYPLIMCGFVVGFVLAIIFGAIKVGWKFAPWIFIGSFLVWFLSWQHFLNTHDTLIRIFSTMVIITKILMIVLARCGILLLTMIQKKDILTLKVGVLTSFLHMTNLLNLLKKLKKSVDLLFKLLYTISIKLRNKENLLWYVHRDLKKNLLKKV